MLQWASYWHDSLHQDDWWLWPVWNNNSLTRNTFVFLKMLGVSGAGLLECKTPTEFNQIWSVPDPTTTVSAARGLQRCVGGVLKTKPINSWHVMLSWWAFCVEGCLLLVFANGFLSPPCSCQVELDQEKGLEMRKWVLSGILASEETYLSHLEALLIVCTTFHAQTKKKTADIGGIFSLIFLQMLIFLYKSRL